MSHYLRHGHSSHVLLFTQRRSYCQSDLLEEQNQGQNISDETDQKTKLKNLEITLNLN